MEPHALAPAAAPGGPLAGLSVLVTRPARQAAPFAAKLAVLGAAPVIFPAIAILPPDDPAPLAAAHARLDDYDLAVFVSANAAEYGVPPGRAWPPGLVALAPGPGTAETLATLGVPDARFPSTTFDSDGLLALPLLADLAGRRIVLFRGQGGREQLPATLAARGAAVDVVACYRRAPPSSLEGLEAAFVAGGIDAVTLTSSEGIDNLWQRLSAGARAAWRARPSFVPHPRIAEHARGLGLAVVETAGSDAGLLAGLIDWVRSHPPKEDDR